MYTTSVEIKRPKPRIRFNIFDVLIILLLIAGVLLILYRAGIFGTSVSFETTATVSFVIGDESGIRDATATYFNVGDSVYLTSSVGKGVSPVGTILSLGTRPHTEERVIDGATVTYTYPSASPTKVEVSGTMKLTGTYGDGGFYIGGRQFAVAGSRIYLCTDKVDFYMTVLSVDVDD